MPIRRHAYTLRPYAYTPSRLHAYDTADTANCRGTAPVLTRWRALSRRRDDAANDAANERCCRGTTPMPTRWRSHSRGRAVMHQRRARCFSEPRTTLDNRCLLHAQGMEGHVAPVFHSLRSHRWLRVEGSRFWVWVYG